MYGSVIGRGAQSVILANGDRAQKIYPAGFPLERVQREVDAQRTALENGVRTPKVYGVKCIEDRPMLVMERINGLPLDELMRRKPDMAPVMLEDFARLQHRIHQIPFEGRPRFSDRVRESIQQLPIAPGKRLGLMSSLRCLPEQTALCHGDFHPQNVMVDEDGPVVIDWVDARMGHPLADACQTYLLLLLHAPQLAESYKDFWDRMPIEDGHTLTDWLTPLAFARRALNRPDEPALASLVDMPPEKS
ncbi:MAG: aminoglycoside phosphotransferase family protein [Clostridia bacterium]|nr:aminoglycoside phosphotransferase family protein [Clostridia bacterium]